MKELFSKAKLGKLRNFLSLLLIMGCYVIYQRFLVVAYYDIGLFIVVTVVAVLYDKFIASKGFDAIVNNACICWTVVGLTLMLRSYYLPEKIYKVPLNGFSTLRVDHIFILALRGDLLSVLSHFQTMPFLIVVSNMMWNCI